MQTIKVDEEVFSLLQKNAKPFIDSPNSTLRRMLGLRLIESEVESKAPTGDLDDLFEEVMARRRTKAPKADLKVLVEAGLLRNGEHLYLVDYQGKRIPQYEAVISGARLEFKGQQFAMSKLAQELLEKIGFKSSSVRGPSHWVTAKNVSITDLWQQLAERKVKK